MKLYHKFLIAMLLISIIPPVLYSLVLLKTTGTKLKKVIDENNANIATSAALEVNKFFVEIEKKLDIARRIERSGRLSNSEKSILLLDGLSSNKLLLAIAMVDESGKTVNAFAARDVALDYDRALLDKTIKTSQVQIGSIGYTRGDNRPYVDAIYPIAAARREYLYLRVGINYVLHRIQLHIDAGEGRKFMRIVIADAHGSAVSTPDYAIKNFSPELLKRYREFKPGQVAVEEGRINMVAGSEGPGWLAILQEPVSEAYSAVTSLKIMAVALIFLTLIFAIAGASLLARNLSKPISVLISGIEKVAVGNLDSQLPMLTNDELSRLVMIFNSMTVKLKKLQEDMKRNERLSTIGQMASILGHEVRNPLAAITNACYLIKMEALKNPEGNQKTLRRIEIIETEIKSTTKIINDMLDYSRSRPPVLAKQDINEVARKIADDVKFPGNVRLEYSFAAVPKIDIDVEEMKQVIRNLINNAIDAMSANGGTLALKTVRKIGVKTNAPVVRLEIADTGCGIPPEIAEKIFEPFFSTKSKGTGLGLAVVKRIVEERHNGAILINSVKDKGTSFYIELPVREDDL
ncbi:MAG: hypothetical protein A2219_02065 [Elusimicrobia bacterium RIFOXYA2_FULL_50_26]|nr:MAG: hypothetical protein A2219_02065 [Elusimicrobia bacterium RIFOXYA2_FULL_50_26]OGS23598.1 MAG: hypothetical protein A2314_09095 [Elusimicrobia bacterium RIFOXYB2_FULL_50_12]